MLPPNTSIPSIYALQNVRNRSVQWLLEKYQGSIKYRTFVNGYRRFDPSRGLDYVMDLAFRDDVGREVIKRYCFLFYLFTLVSDSVFTSININSLYFILYFSVLASTENPVGSI